MGRYLSDLWGTLHKYFSTEGGILFKELLGTSADIPEEEYVLLYINPDGIVKVIKSDGMTATVGPITLQGTGGIITSLLGNTWYIDGSTISGGVGQGAARIMGIGYFTPDGYRINHSLNNVDHYTSITPAGSSDFDEQAIASIGDLYIKIGVNEDTVYNTGGPTTSGIGFYWEISYTSNAESNYTSVRGVSSFTPSGTEIHHNLGTFDHFTSVSPASTIDYNEYNTASIGDIYIKIGYDSDFVYATGGADVDGLPFYWEATTSGILDYVTQEQLTTTSGDIINLIPSVTVSGNLMGTGVFDYTGVVITHNLGTVNHYVAITPADAVGFDEHLVASLGNIYVHKGSDQDVVYHTGGTRANGLKFDWEVIKHGLKMIEE